MALAKVKRFAQVTIPAEIRRRAHVAEGDYVDVQYEEGRITLTPKRLADKTEDWARRFDDALGKVREAARRARITERQIHDAMKAARQGPGR